MSTPGREGEGHAIGTERLDTAIQCESIIVCCCLEGSTSIADFPRPIIAQAGLTAASAAAAAASASRISRSSSRINKVDVGQQSMDLHAYMDTLEATSANENRPGGVNTD